MRFFTDEKVRLGTAHTEYALFWRDKLKHIPSAALTLSGGMLPTEFFAETNRPIHLHDGRLKDAIVSGNEFWLVLETDENGRSRHSAIQYDNDGGRLPNVDRELFSDTPDSDIAMHEFGHGPVWFYHQILFAGGKELRIPFRRLEFQADYAT